MIDDVAILRADHRDALAGISPAAAVADDAYTAALHLRHTGGKVVRDHGDHPEGVVVRNGVRRDGRRVFVVIERTHPATLHLTIQHWRPEDDGGSSRLFTLELPVVQPDVLPLRSVDDLAAVLLLARDILAKARDLSDRRERDAVFDEKDIVPSPSTLRLVASLGGHREGLVLNAPTPWASAHLGSVGAIEAPDETLLRTVLSELPQAVGVVAPATWPPAASLRPIDHFARTADADPVELLRASRP